MRSQRHHYVYSLFDPDSGALLYVGRSNRPEQRLYAFRKRTGIQAIAGMNLRFTEFEDAAKAELERIRRHMPPFNRVVASSRGSLGKKRTNATRAKMRRTKNLNKRKAK